MHYKTNQDINTIILYLFHTNKILTIKDLRIFKESKKDKEFLTFLTKNNYIIPNKIIIKLLIMKNKDNTMDLNSLFMIVIILNIQIIVLNIIVIAKDKWIIYHMNKWIMITNIKKNICIILNNNNNINILLKHNMLIKAELKKEFNHQLREKMTICYMLTEENYKVNQDNWIIKIYREGFQFKKNITMLENNKWIRYIIHNNIQNKEIITPYIKIINI